MVTKMVKMIILPFLPSFVMFNRQAERITRVVNKHTSLESFRVLMDKLLKSIFLISIRFSSHRDLDQDEMKVRDELFTFDGPCYVNNNYLLHEWAISKQNQMCTTAVCRMYLGFLLTDLSLFAV